MTLAVRKRLFALFRDNESRIHDLRYLFWECTTRCNLFCLHCGSDCLKESFHPDFPLDVFLSALDSIPEKFRKNITVVLSGGEPLLRRDLELCGREIRRRGMRWGMVSNGYLYDNDRHISLLNAGMGSLTLSLDGLKDHHNWLRNNPRSFDRVVEAVRLAAVAPRLNFDVVSCIHQRNMETLPEMYDLLKTLGVKAWRLFTITPIGRAAGRDELFLESRQFLSMMDFIVEKREAGEMDVKFSCEGYTGPYEGKIREGYFFCRAGIHIGSVLIDGSISACPNIDRNFSQGNVYHDSFFHVWDKRFQVFRDRSWARTGKCQQCKEFRYCQGNGMHYWHGERQEVLVCHREWLNGA